jgi:hypothetical protein
MILTLDQTKALLHGNKNVDEWHKVMVELLTQSMTSTRHHALLVSLHSVELFP